MTLPSPCKVNLLLNILGKRPDGFHELETIFQPVELHDVLSFSKISTGVQLTCSDVCLPVDSSNLVHRAATAFLADAAITGDGVRIHLEKRIPMAAGLGGGSSNAAVTLLGLNALFGHPMSPERLSILAATLGSDVPFFLQSHPAVGTGRGENVTSLPPFRALRGSVFLLIHPGFGISTAWAYQELARFPGALQGTPGRAQKLIALLNQDSLVNAGAEFYNALEAPAFLKYPILALYQKFLRESGGVTLMSGSGSTTFAIFPNRTTASVVAEAFCARFGPCWTAIV